MGVFSLTKEKNIVSCITNLTLIFLIKKTHKKINFQSNSISILLILQYYLFLTIKHNTIKSNFQIPQQDPIGYTIHDRNIFLGHILDPMIKIFLGCFGIPLSTPTKKLGQCPPPGSSARQFSSWATWNVMSSWSSPDSMTQLFHLFLNLFQDSTMLFSRDKAGGGLALFLSAGEGVGCSSSSSDMLLQIG